MRNLIFVLILMFLNMLTVNATVMEGGIRKNGVMNSKRIIDRGTNLPVQGAKVSLPKMDFVTVTDDNGVFNLNTNINGPMILSVEKEGYRPFSLTIDKSMAQKPLIVGIEKSKIQDIVISSQMFHLGDDNFSSNSANSSEFRRKSIGPFFSQSFKISPNSISKRTFLVIGSIIGIDTMMARTMKQNSITNSFSSPPEVFFNGVKIASIQLNGDGQKILIPNNLLKIGGMNEVIIHTGKNLRQTAYIDYDDIEFMNLSIESE